MSCTPGAIIYKKESSGMFSTKGSKYQEDLNVSVPVQIRGQWGCYQRKDAINLEKKKKKTSMEVEITPLKVDFENVADAHVGQYVHIDGNQIYLVSFICSGENMIGHSSYYDAFLNVPIKAEQNFKVGSVFATGMAARNLESSYAKKEQAMEKFADLYHVKDQAVQPEDCFIPAIISTSSIDMHLNIQRQIESSFKSRNNSVVNGCSNGFKEKMKDFKIETVLKKKGEIFLVSLPGK